MADLYAAFNAEEEAVLGWLTGEGLGQFVNSFRLAGITTPERFCRLEPSLFESLGVHSEADRSRLFVLVERARRAFSAAHVGFAAVGAAGPPPHQPPLYDERKPAAVPNYHAVAHYAAPPLAPQQETGEPTAASRAFRVSSVKRYKPNGSALCRAEGCDKIAQSKSNGFCRRHFKLYQSANGADREPSDGWDCFCGSRNPAAQKRCGTCQRWKDSRRPKPAPLLAADAGPDEVGSAARTFVPPASGVEVSPSRRVNDNGRQLCKVEGCAKLLQARNDGFCRMHFNMFAVGDPPGAAAVAMAVGSYLQPNAIGSAAIAQHVEQRVEEALASPWTCTCGVSNPCKQPRCGTCQQWKDGKRKSHANGCDKSSKQSTMAAALDNSGAWDCDNCGNRVLATKSRCGKCHRWKGGKRKGGWKIKATEKPDDGTVPWHLPWTCCGVTHGAEKRRCGKCSRWRGGKRRRKDPVTGTAGPPRPSKAVVLNDVRVPALPEYAMPAVPLYGYPHGDLALPGYLRQFEAAGLALPEPIPGYPIEAAHLMPEVRQFHGAGAPPPFIAAAGRAELATEGGELAPEGVVADWPQSSGHEERTDRLPEENNADTIEKQTVGV